MLKYLFSIILFVPLLVSASYIHGVVYCKDDGEPIEGVNVIIKELQKGCITDKKGEFDLPGINQGNYTIITSHLGYKTETQTVAVSGDKAFIKFKIEKDDKYIDEVVVASERYEYLKKVPSRIDVIKAESIEISPESNVTGLLENMSGVNVENTMGIYSSKATVSLRGLSGNDQSRTLILFDDIPLNSSDGGSVNWNMIAKDNIESIEIMKGCSSPKYGSNAMGGVINIVTKKPSKPFEGYAKAAYGTYNTMASSVLISGNVNSGDNNRFYWSATSSALKSDGYIAELVEIAEVIDDIIVPIHVEEFNSNLKLGYLLNKKHNFEIYTNYYEDLRGDGVYVYEGGFSEHATLFSTFKYTYHNENIMLNTRTYNLDEDYHKQEVRMSNENEFLLTEVDSRRKDIGANADLSVVKGINTYSVGVAAKQGGVDGKDTYFTKSTLLENGANMDILGFYIQDEIDLANSGVQISFGLRFDYASLKDTRFDADSLAYDAVFYDNYKISSDTVKNWHSFCPKFSIQKRFDDNTRVYFSYGRGFKAPLLDDLCRTQKKDGRVKAANPNLEPETIDNFEVGIDYAITPKIKIKHSAYFNIGNDFMYTMSTGESVNLVYATRDLLITDNISKVHIYGIETDIEYSISNSIKMHGNYTYNVSQIKEHSKSIGDTLYDYTNKYLTYVPMHKFSGGFTYMNRIVDVSINAKYIGERWIDDMNEPDEELGWERFPAYTVVNLKLHRNVWRGLSATIDVNNVFDEFYIDKKYQRCPGRLITGQLMYRF